MPSGNEQRGGTDRSGDERQRNGSDNAGGVVEALQRVMFENYVTLAYVLIVGTYIVAFGLYLYLRIVSIVFPETITYKRSCEKLANETIVRTEFHYASTTVIFLVIGLFQLACFFMLTISRQWLEVRRTYSNFLSLEEKLRNELVFAIKRVMYITVFPAFLVYGMCSILILSSIFYMIGMRDPVRHVGSRVIIHLFDACVLLYFVAFPLVSLIYHPDIHCRPWCR
ncbi:Protein C32D5.7 [Aphelenchoides avenae]|nr:Protein C32D5.7 [Aphelenchus avenae]